MELLKAIKLLGETPLPTLLIVFGLGFVLLAIADRVHGSLAISGKNKKYALALGLFLLIIGLGVTVAGVVIVPPVDEKMAKDSLTDWFDPRSNPSFSCRQYAKRPRKDRTPQSDIICRFKDLSDADKSLGDAYDSYLSTIPADNRTFIRRKQRQWIDQRNINCPATWSDFEVSDTLITKLKCMTTETNDRTEYFLKLVDTRKKQSP